MKTSQVALMANKLLANAGDPRNVVQSLGQDAPGGGCGIPLWYYCLAYPIDRGASQATVHRVANSRQECCDLVCTHMI